MLDFLVVWYALGWAAVSIYCREFGKLTLCELIMSFLGGGIAFVVHFSGWLALHGTDPVIWRRK